MKVKPEIDLGEGPTEKMCAKWTINKEICRCNYLIAKHIIDNDERLLGHTWYCDLFKHEFEKFYSIDCKRIKKCKEAKV